MTIAHKCPARSTTESELAECWLALSVSIDTVDSWEKASQATRGLVVLDMGRQGAAASALSEFSPRPTSQILNFPYFPNLILNSVLVTDWMDEGLKE